MIFLSDSVALVISGFLGLWDFRDVVDIFFVWCLGVVICQNQDFQDYRIFGMLF